MTTKKTIKTKRFTFEQWKANLREDQIDFILNDYMGTHPDFNEKTQRISIEVEGDSE